MHQASVGFQCPECVAGSSQKVIRADQVLAPSQPVVTILLVALNVAAFVYTSTPPGFDGAVSGPLVAQGDWWRLISSGFLHVGIFHIGMNMFALWQLGRNLESTMGSVDFTILYFGSLFSGSLAVALFDAPAVGASGAIFGLFGALAMLYSSRGISLVKSGMMGLLIMNLGVSLLPQVSWQGHLGGFVGGLLFGAIFFVWDKRLRKINRYLPEVVGIVAAIGFLAGGYYGAELLFG